MTRLKPITFIRYQSPMTRDEVAAFLREYRRDIIEYSYDGRELKTREVFK